MTRSVRLVTGLGAALRFASLEGSEELSHLGEFRVTAVSRRGDIDPAELLGRSVSVVLGLPQGGEREFNGLAAAVVLLGGAGRLHRYLIVVRPWTWLLGRTSDCRIFQEQSTEDIVRAVFASHPYADFRFELRDRYPQRTYCVQYRETDFNFVARLLEQEGMHFFFRHADGRHTLVISDGPHSHRGISGYESVDFIASEAGPGGQREGLRVWTQDSEIQPAHFASRDYDFEKPHADLQARAAPARPARHEHADRLEIYDYPGDYTERSDGERLARMRAEAWRQQQEQFRGEGDAAGLGPGARFGLVAHPRADQNQDYLVLAADYSILDGDHESGVAAGALLGVRLRAIPAAQEFRPARRTPKPVIQGPQTAIVVGRRGDEIHTDRQGRIKVRFHWDRHGRGDEHSSCWIRVAQPWAGQHWGMIALPRVGQEVVVEFLEGDPDRPLVTGSVYNAAQPPPYALPGQAARSGIRSHSTPGADGSHFNELRFDDRSGAEELHLRAERDHTLKIQRDRVEWIGHESHRTVEKDMFERCEGEHHLRVAGDQNVALGGSQSLSIGQDCQIRVGQRIAAEAGEEIHLAAGTRLVLEAGARISLKVGASFIDISAAGVFIDGPQVRVRQGGSPASGAGADPQPPAQPRGLPESEVAIAPAAPEPGPEAPVASPQAQALRQARAAALPFVAKCPAATRG